MLSICKVRKQFLNTFPSVIHFDGTSRAQAVFKENNPRFYNLLSFFKNKSRHPVLLNTSFNLKDEPIVDSPYDALKTFLWCELDYLFLENYLVSKQ